MGFRYDSTGIDTDQGGGWQLLPEDDYTLRIIDVEEKESSRGDHQVQIDTAVIEPVKYKDVEVRHWVTFFKDPSNKGAGIAIQFLKAIEQPWEGKFDVDAKAWINKRFRAHVAPNTYTSKGGTERTNNKIKYLVERDHVAEQEARAEVAQYQPPPAASEAPAEGVPF